ncbi:MAG: GNAT family N-acetyltransferase [Chromatiales bacterium]|jgi:GNAT superfamily N-acetyltransferase
MNPAISKVTETEQVAAVARLAELIWREHFTSIIGADQVAYMLEKFQSSRAIASQLTSGIEYYMAEVDGNQVGYTAIMPDRSNGRMMISKLYVRREQRGGGVGSGVLKFIESECARRGFTTLWLTVNRFNDGPIRWYLRQGFRKVDEVKKDIGGGFYMDDYIMQKNL